MEDNKVEILERLAVISDVLQVGSFFMNAEQLSNDDLMKELKFQNVDYLEMIIKKQNEMMIVLNNILERLDKLEKI